MLEAMAMRSPKWFVCATRDKQTLRTELKRELADRASKATHFSWEKSPTTRSRASRSCSPSSSSSTSAGRG